MPPAVPDLAPLLPLAVPLEPAGELALGLALELLGGGGVALSFELIELNMDEPVSVPSTEVRLLSPLLLGGGGDTATGGGGETVTSPEPAAAVVCAALGVGLLAGGGGGDGGGGGGVVALLTALMT